MNNFLDKILNGGSTTSTNDTYKAFVKYMENPKLEIPDVFDDLDENCTNSKDLLRDYIFPGSIYIFEYSSLAIQKYSSKKKGDKPILFVDTTPIVLVTKNAAGYIKGINLNFCNKDLRAIILNIFNGIDSDYFNGGAAKLVADKKVPISEKIYKFLCGIDSELQLIKALKLHYPNVDYNFLFRTYNISGIKHIRYIEPFMWQYIPNYVYANNKMNKEIIDLILIRAGITTVKV